MQSLGVMSLHSLNQLSEVTMVTHEVVFKNVSFTYDTLPDTLFTGIDLSVEKGWTGLVGPNGSGKTTILKLAAGRLEPGTGRVIFGGEAGRLLGMLGIKADWIDRWESLSHGERKRMQLGAALRRSPDLLAVDVPTNHMDLLSVECVEDVLSTVECALVLVSHDLRFLDNLADERWSIESSRDGRNCSLRKYSTSETS